MSTLSEAIESVLASREVAERIAAAREEQREVIAREFITTPSGEIVTTKWHQDMAAVVRGSPLTSTPLADRIESLRADLTTAAAVTAELRAEVERLEAEVEAADASRRLARVVHHEAEADVERLRAEVERLKAEAAAPRVEKRCPRYHRDDKGLLCGGLLVSQEWAEGMNHRAKPGQLVCCACGYGTDATPEEYAAQLQRDRAYDAGES